MAGWIGVKMQKLTVDPLLWSSIPLIRPIDVSTELDSVYEDEGRIITLFGQALQRASWVFWSLFSSCLFANTFVPYKTVSQDGSYCFDVMHCSGPGYEPDVFFSMAPLVLYKNLEFYANNSHHRGTTYVCPPLFANWLAACTLFSLHISLLCVKCLLPLTPFAHTVSAGELRRHIYKSFSQ